MGIPQDIAALQVSVSSLTELAADLGGRVGQVVARLAQLEADVAALTATAQQRQGEIDRLKLLVARLESRRR